jgi:hypothetical protein
MKRTARLSALALLLLAASIAWGGGMTAPSPNGMTIPEGFENWPVISVSHRMDNHTLRVILGNDIAVEAARGGKTDPWPDGAVLAKVVWKERPEEAWPDAIVPDKLVHVEFMHKDAAKYAGNGTGWGWARWLGPELKPYGADVSVENECIDCHVPIEERDWVYTIPARFP